MHRHLRSLQHPLVLPVILAAAAGACAPGDDAADDSVVVTDALAGWTNSAGWTNLGSTTSGIAVSRRGQIADAWESRSDRALYRNSFNDAWSGWTNVNAGPLSAHLDRGFFGAPSVLGGTSDATNVVEVVVKDLGSEIQWATWRTCGCSWGNHRTGSPTRARSPAAGPPGRG
jgi:hypothetical protein